VLVDPAAASLGRDGTKCPAATARFVPFGA
jgi:hypothetical protein